jgi:lipoate-protein ligase A
MTWRLIDDDSTDVYQNLALDEAIARHAANQIEKSNTIRFWRSEKAVVIGRFQCVHKEVNFSYCSEEKIAIARRFTGGGAVFHDKGNLNFSICADRAEKYISKTLKEIYELFIGSMATSLQSIDIPAQYDLKITGTAGWLKRGVAFLHGTLLINSDLHMLRKCLSPQKGQPVFLRDKTRVRCMESKRDFVTNITEVVEDCPSDETIKNAIIKSIEKISRKSVERKNLSLDEMNTAQALYQSRYSQSEWNLGTPAQ